MALQRTKQPFVTLKACTLDTEENAICYMEDLLSVWLELGKVYSVSPWELPLRVLWLGNTRLIVGSIRADQA